MPLSDITVETILGSLLGDGSLKLYRPYKNARFSFKHSTKQKEYFWWKVNALKEISSDSCVWEQHEEGYGKEKLRYQSLALEPLTDLCKLTSEGKVKRVKRKWLNKLTPLSLLIWWLDDGSLIGNTRKGVFCTDGFSEKEVKIIGRYLKVVWKIQTKIAKSSMNEKGERYNRLYIYSGETLQSFFRIILPFLKVEQMLPKVLIVYQDPKLQQRWTSEVSRLTGFSSETVQHYLEIKKSRMKKYQKMI